MIDHTRHMGIFNAGIIDVCLIGAGGIGAITAITLGKMGVRSINIFDADSVDEVNIATQFHRVSDVGLNKADATSSVVGRFADHIATPFLSRVDDSTKLPLAEIYISAVDSISSRQGIWQAVKNVYHSQYFFPQTPPPMKWYIDARMGAEVYEHFVVHIGANYTWYESYLEKESDDDFEEVPCTSKATIYTANTAAGHIGAAVRRIITNEQKPGLLHHDILHNQLNFLDM